MAKYDLYADSVIDDFDNWLREHPQGVWYACDEFNCPWRSFVRDHDYEVTFMRQYNFGLTDGLYYRNPVFAQDFIELLDMSDGGKSENQPFEVGSEDCLKVLHRIKSEKEKALKNVQFRNGIPTNH